MQFLYLIRVASTFNSKPASGSKHVAMTKGIGVQTDIFLAASSPKQPSTPTATTTFSFTDDDET